MINISENKKSEDTYEHIRALAEEQIAKERAVRDELDGIESDLTELWDEYYDIPYGSKYTIRIKAELPGNIEKQLYGLLKGKSDKGKSDKALIKVLSVMTDGIYKGEKMVHATDNTFWENSANWNMRKVESIIMSYLSRLKEEREKIYTFPGAQTSENADIGPSDDQIEQSWA